MTFLLKIIITILCSALILLLFHVKKRKSHPPGPLGFPLVGLLPWKIIQLLFSNYLPKIDERKYWRQMKEKYGDYWSMEMGGQRVVAFASLEIVTEAFVNNGDIFAGRSLSEILQVTSSNQGVSFTSGETWLENRRMAFKALREFGMGKSKLIVQICNEGNELIEYLTNISSKPIYPTRSFIKAISNVISKLVFNERDNYNDPKFETYVNSLKCIFQSKVIHDECVVFPKFASTRLGRFLFSKVDDYINSWNIVQDFIKNKCVNKIKSETEIGSPECVFDYFWKYRYEYDPTIGNDEKLHNIFITMVDLYNAGSDTGNGLLMFSCLILGRYQNIQKELRDELKLLTDDYRQINVGMKKNCPKFLSFIDEVQRYCNIVPKYFRNVLKQCNFKGYALHPNDALYIDLATIFRDPDLFPNPDLFDPYRFMDESKTQYVANKNLIPFGIGKRICIGMKIANIEIFVFLTKIIHSFYISLPKETLDNFDDIMVGTSGITHGPLDHELNFDLINIIQQT